MHDAHVLSTHISHCVGRGGCVTLDGGVYLRQHLAHDLNLSVMCSNMKRRHPGLKQILSNVQLPESPTCRTTTYRQYCTVRYTQS